MFKAALSPDILYVPTALPDTKAIPLWKHPEILGLETATVLLPTDNYAGITSSSFHVWIDDNGTPAKIDLSTFADQFPHAAGTLLKSLHLIQPWQYAEAMDRKCDLTANDDYCDVTILFTPTGTVGWVSAIDYTLDELHYESETRPFTTQEKADEAAAYLSPGRVCALFEAEPTSAHRILDTLPFLEQTFETWKKLVPHLYADLFTLTEWSFKR